MYALVEINGQQLKVSQGSLVKVNRINEEPGTKVEFDKVLMICEDKKQKIGTPYVKSAKVSATIGQSLRDKKIIVGKFKRRKGYRRRQGHRQYYTLLKIDQISD